MYKLDIKKYVDANFNNINQFARAIHVEQPTAKKLYTGDLTRPSLENIYNICQLFNCTPNDIIVDDGVEQIISDNKKDLNYKERVITHPTEIFVGKEAIKRAIYTIIDENLDDILNKSTIKSDSGDAQ